MRSQTPRDRIHVINYPYEEYYTDTQNFDIIIADNHILAANSAGLLRLTGNIWQVDQYLADERIISLACYNDTVYSISETNIFACNAGNSTLQSELLTSQDRFPILPNEKFRQLLSTKQGLLILTTNRLLLYNEQRFETLSPPSIPIQSIVSDGGNALVLTGDGSLFKLHGRSFFRLINSSKLISEKLFASQTNPDESRIVVLSSGVYILRNGVLHACNESLQRSLLQTHIHAADMNDSHCVIATNNGMFILHLTTNTYRHISTQNHSKGDPIYAVTLNNTAAWVAHDNGISAVLIESPISLIASRSEIGRIQSVERIDSTIYVHASDVEFTLDPLINELCRSNRTECVNSNNRSRFIEDSQTCWLISSADSLQLIRTESDRGSHTIAKTFHSIGKQKGLFYANKCVICYNGKGFFVFDRVRNEMIPYHTLNQQLGEFIESDYVCEAYGNQYWFCMGDQLALVRLSDNNVEIPLRINLTSWGLKSVSRNRSILSVSDSVHLVSTMQGLVEINSKQLIRQSQRYYSVPYIRSICVNDTLNIFPQRSTIELSANTHSVAITYSFTERNTQPIISYKTNAHNRWSEWESTNSISLRNLSVGKHVLTTRLYNSTGIFPTHELTLLVSPPWYYSPMAILLYIIMGIVSLFSINRAFVLYRESKIRKRIEIKQKEMQTNEIIHQNEQYKTDLLQKNNNLAMQASLLAKHEMQIESIRKEVESHKEQLGDRYPSKLYQRLLKILASDDESGSEWIMFEAHFNEVHQQFTGRLCAAYPDLTANDLRMCCFLRMNLTTKEIASLMNVSVRAIELRRHRMRKRLNLEIDSNLNTFLLNF